MKPSNKASPEAMFFIVLHALDQTLGCQKSEADHIELWCYWNPHFGNPCTECSRLRAKIERGFRRESDNELSRLRADLAQVTQERDTMQHDVEVYGALLGRVAGETARQHVQAVQRHVDSVESSLAALRTALVRTLHRWREAGAENQFLVSREDGSTLLVDRQAYYWFANELAALLAAEPGEK